MPTAGQTSSFMDAPNPLRKNSPKSSTDPRLRYSQPSEKFRGQHIGQALYGYVKGYAKENGFYNITLNVWSRNTNAIGFYESLGMQVQKIGMEEILLN